MKRGTKVLLLSGCAVVLLLELPGALACLAAGWNGPYAEPLAARTPPGAAALAVLPASTVGRLELAGR